MNPTPSQVTQDSAVAATNSRLGWIKWLGGMVAVGASIATIITLALQVRTLKPGAELQILATERLTTLPSAPGLVSEYRYQGRVIADLWRINFRVVNVGDVTLLTDGPKANVLQGGILFSFPNNIRILQQDSIRSDFPHTLSVDSTRRNIELRFSQWRANESAIYSLYVEGFQRLNQPPLPIAPERRVVDGDISIVRFSGFAPRERKSLLYRLPAPVSLAGRIMGGALAGFVTFFCSYVVIVGAIERSRAERWNEEVGPAFTQYVNESVDIGDHEKAIYRVQPWRMPRVHWRRFSGPEYPTIGGGAPYFESWRNFVNFAPFLLLSSIAAIALLASVITV